MEKMTAKEKMKVMSSIEKKFMGEPVATRTTHEFETKDGVLVELHSTVPIVDGVNQAVENSLCLSSETNEVTAILNRSEIRALIKALQAFEAAY